MASFLGKLLYLFVPSLVYGATEQRAQTMFCSAAARLWKYDGMRLFGWPILARQGRRRRHFSCSREA
jgi:hypothetical protein